MASLAKNDGGSGPAPAGEDAQRKPGRSFLPPLLVAATFVTAAAFTWRRLGSLLIDGGRELEVPRRVLAGDVLYRDVRYYWGPLAPHVNAVAYGIFGVSSLD
jgi:hypothetical protein